jgi:A/G-specific adenine glycosylase
LRDAPKVASDLVKWHALADNPVLPWRGSQDPYAILMAVLMLRHTAREQAARVFSDFIRRYPTVDVLASADRQELKEMLRPLGLVNSRTDIFLEVAARLAREPSFPSTLPALLELPGVGTYSASTVLCVAFGQELPMVDVNSERVIGRVFGPDATQDFFRSAHADVRKLNLALLDFAHYVCKAKNPRCESCLINSYCLFYKNLKRNEP